MFLERILEEKKKEVEQLKQRRDAFPETRAVRRSLSQALKEGPQQFGLIAEVKKASPSKGLIRADFDPTAVACRYASAGAQAVSVLTDKTFFQGDLSYLTSIRKVVDLPLLRKDFIIDRIQIDESVAFGADAILLIAAALEQKQLTDLCRYAQKRGLEVLLEIHTEEELAPAIEAQPDVIGINNRNLHTFDVSLDVTRRLIRHIPQTIPVVSESGISTPEVMQELQTLGLSGVLVGEFLMRQEDVADGIHYLRGVPAR